MGRPRKFDDNGNPIADAVEKTVKFRFSKIWSTPDAAYFPGQSADLPLSVAESLYLEECGEILEAGA